MKTAAIQQQQDHAESERKLWLMREQLQGRDPKRVAEFERAVRIATFFGLAMIGAATVGFVGWHYVRMALRAWGWL